MCIYDDVSFFLFSGEYMINESFRLELLKYSLVVSVFLSLFEPDVCFANLPELSLTCFEVSHMNLQVVFSIEVLDIILDI